MRLAQDADQSRAQREMLQRELDGLIEERLSLLTAIQDKDEQLISLTTRDANTGLVLQDLETDLQAWSTALLPLADRNNMIRLRGPSGQTVEIRMSRTTGTPESIRVLP